MWCVEKTAHEWYKSFTDVPTMKINLETVMNEKSLKSIYILNRFVKKYSNIYTYSV